jgi:flagellum-specific peptidoglycan hydrolase FlgJ
MDVHKQQFLTKAKQQAEAAAHIFPSMAACEAALESGYGVSGLAIADNNLFGMKQHQHPIYGTHVLPTKEFVNKEWIVVNANWIHYPDMAACFTDRMNTLRRLSTAYPHYAAALAAPDAVAFVTEVSRTWSTDPNRAAKVIAIYRDAIPFVFQGDSLLKT